MDVAFTKKFKINNILNEDGGLDLNENVTQALRCYILHFADNQLKLVYLISFLKIKMLPKYVITD